MNGSGGFQPSFHETFAPSLRQGLRHSCGAGEFAVRLVSTGGLFGPNLEKESPIA
jgi:hypothetical protein